MNRRVAWAMASIAILGGCSEPAACPDVQGPTTIEIGAGSATAQLFSPWHEGDTTTLVAGAQGGQHIWIQLRGHGLCGEHPRVRMRVVRATDNASIGLSVASGAHWTSDGAEGVVSPSLRATIDPDQYCPILHGGMVRIEVNVDDGDGRTADASIPLVVQGWSSDSSEIETMSRNACCANYSNPVCWPNGPPADAANDASTDAANDADDVTVDAGD